MRIEDLTVALRPRTAWEAVELGTALVRRHAGAVWKPWLLLSLPVLVLLNALCWLFGEVWLAGLLMWWLKPVFDRIPLYVLSRAVFGHVPPVRETVRAQRHFGRRTAVRIIRAEDARQAPLVLAIFFVTQLLDGSLTYWGVTQFGIQLEMNSLLAATMHQVGPFAALVGAKGLACACGIVLYTNAYWRSLAAMAGLCLGVAVVPWLAMAAWVSAHAWI